MGSEMCIRDRFLSDGTNAFLPGLAVLQSFVKGLFEFNNIISLGFLVGDILHIVFVLFGFPIARGDHIIEDV